MLVLRMDQAFDLFVTRHPRWRRPAGPADKPRKRARVDLGAADFGGLDGGIRLEIDGHSIRRLAHGRGKGQGHDLIDHPGVQDLTRQDDAMGLDGERLIALGEPQAGIGA